MNRMTYVEIAKLCHKVNKEYCESLGDNSQVEWDACPEWQKDSAINGVEYHMITPNATPKTSHESWLKQKENAGWKYGDEKNVELKTHPCMVPYEKLPLAQRSKDHIFKAICDFFKEEYGKPYEPKPHGLSVEA
jgi:hypothetical protein